MKIELVLSGWLVLGGLSGAAAATGPAGQEDEIERLTDWPELDRDQTRTVEKDVARLRKARTEEMGEQAHDALVAVGAGCAPFLLEALGKEKDEAARERIVAVLELVTGAPHTRLLAGSFEDQSAEVRTWSLRRAALFPDPGLRQPAEQALARLQEAAGSRQAPEEAELLAGALAATSAGSTQGLEILFEHAVEDWSRIGRNVRTACEGARSDEASARVVGFLTGTEDRAERVAAIRLLGGCGTEVNAVAPLRPLLDSDDSTIRIAAINALRGIVDGEPPLERLSVFDSIELAKTWKKRIG